MRRRPFAVSECAGTGHREAGIGFRELAEGQFITSQKRSSVAACCQCVLKMYYGGIYGRNIPRNMLGHLDSR